MVDLRCCDFRWYSRDAEQFPLWRDYTTDRAGRHRKSSDNFLKFAMAFVQLDFGRTFVATDPDGHRLRVFVPAVA